VVVEPFTAETLEEEDGPDVLEQLLQKATNPTAEFLAYLVNVRGETYRPEE
jgi:hypothetical protein